MRITKEPEVRKQEILDTEMCKRDRYYPADSPLHRMDARVKIIITLLYIISLFVIKSFIGYAFVILCLAAVIKISKVPFRFMVKGLKAVSYTHLDVYKRQQQVLTLQ